mgnify:CR=1 FL=1
MDMVIARRSSSSSSKGSAALVLTCIGGWGAPLKRRNSKTYAQSVTDEEVASTSCAQVVRVTRVSLNLIQGDHFESGRCRSGALELRAYKK